MRRVMFLMLTAISATAFAQAGYNPAVVEQQTRELNARAFYLETGMTPGDWNKLSKVQQEAFKAKLRCKEIHHQIDEQIALERSGHVGFYDWQNLRGLEQQDCPQEIGYRFGESPNDTMPKEITLAPMYVHSSKHGSVELRFHLRKNQLRNLTIAASSGDSALDKEAIRQAKNTDYGVEAAPGQWILMQVIFN